MFEILESTLNQKSRNPSRRIRQGGHDPPKPEVILQNATAPNATPSIPKIGRFETSGFFLGEQNWQAEDFVIQKTIQHLVVFELPLLCKI